MECCIYIDSERDLLNFLFQIFLMKKLKTLYQSYLVVDLGGGGEILVHALSLGQHFFIK